MVTGQMLSDGVRHTERAQDQHIQQLPVLLGEPRHTALGAARSAFKDLDSRTSALWRRNVTHTTCPPNSFVKKLELV